MKRTLVFLTALSATISAQTPSPGRNPVLVELFTSAGCPDCLEADQLLQRIDREQPFGGSQIVVLSEHVDVFDGIGRRDPASSRLLTERLHEYAALIGGKLIARTERAQYRGAPVARSASATEAYLPQFIIDGSRGFAGSDWGDMQQGIRAVSASPKSLLQVYAERRGNRTRILIQSSQKPDGNLYVALAYETGPSRATTGEDAAHALSQVAVVYSLRQMGEMRPAAAGYELEIIENVHKESRIVAFIAKPTPGSADDAVKLTQKALGRSIEASGPGRVTAIGIGRL